MSQQLRNQLTGLMPTEAMPTLTQAQRELLLPTWQTHIVIPLTQNLLGGVAVAGLCWVFTVGLGRYFLWQVIVDELAIWSMLAGGLVTFVATVIRFFGDDLGIVGAAYRLGKRSAETQISALVAENEQLRATARELRSDENTLRAKDMLETIERAQRDAEHLLGLAYGGQSIAREKVSAYIPQRSWEKAMQLIRAAGCLDTGNDLTESNLGLALKRLRGFVRMDIERANKGNWRPKWLVGAKH